jgi:hypothetical protein
MCRKCFLLIAAVLSFLSLRDALAAEGSPTPPDGSERIAALIEQLEHAAFSERQAASQSLAEAGAEALKQLEETAARGSREAAGRALEIVKQHFQNGEARVKEEAREALSRLASSDNVAVSQRAHNLLYPPKTSMLPVGVPFGMPNARNALAMPPATRTLTTHEANGVRDVDARENGRRTRIQTFPNGRIQFEFTEPINGRDVTRRIDAKDLSELRRKDAEAGQLYDLYNAAPRPAAVRTSSNSRG